MNPTTHRSPTFHLPTSVINTQPNLSYIKPTVNQSLDRPLLTGASRLELYLCSVAFGVILGFMLYPAISVGILAF